MLHLNACDNVFINILRYTYHRRIGDTLGSQSLGITEGNYMNTGLVYKVAALVLVVGGLNLGLMGAFSFDAIGAVVHSALAIRIIDIVIGVAAVVTLYAMFGAKK